MNRDADRAALIGNGACDRLPNPPGRIGAELVAFAVVKLFHCPNEADIAFLNEIGKRHPAQRVAFGDGNNQPQVGLGQNGFGFLVAALNALRQTDFFRLATANGVRPTSRSHMRTESSSGIPSIAARSSGAEFRLAARSRRCPSSAKAEEASRSTEADRRTAVPLSSSRKCRTSSTGWPDVSARSSGRLRLRSQPS